MTVSYIVTEHGAGNIIELDIIAISHHKDIISLSEQLIFQNLSHLKCNSTFSSSIIKCHSTGNRSCIGCTLSSASAGCLCRTIRVTLRLYRSTTGSSMPGIHANHDILTVRICKINSSRSRIDCRKVCVLPGRVKADLLSIAVKSRCAGQRFLLGCGFRFRSRCVGGISRRSLIYSFIFRIRWDRKIICCLGWCLSTLCCVRARFVLYATASGQAATQENGTR